MGRFLNGNRNKQKSYLVYIDEDWRRYNKNKEHSKDKWVLFPWIFYVKNLYKSTGELKVKYIPVSPVFYLEIQHKSLNKSYLFLNKLKSLWKISHIMLLWRSKNLGMCCEATYKNVNPLLHQNILTRAFDAVLVPLTSLESGVAYGCQK